MNRLELIKKVAKEIEIKKEASKNDSITLFVSKLEKAGTLNKKLKFLLNNLKNQEAIFDNNETISIF